MQLEENVWNAAMKRGSTFDSNFKQYIMFTQGEANLLEPQTKVEEKMKKPIVLSNKGLLHVSVVSGQLVAFCWWQSNYSLRPFCT
jgi:hypothetical protein